MPGIREYPNNFCVGRLSVNFCFFDVPVGVLDVHIVSDAKFRPILGGILRLKMGLTASRVAHCAHFLVGRQERLVSSGQG